LGLLGCAALDHDFSSGVEDGVHRDGGFVGHVFFFCGVRAWGRDGSGKVLLVGMKDGEETTGH